MPQSSGIQVSSKRMVFTPVSKNAHLTWKSLCLQVLKVAISFRVTAKPMVGFLLYVGSWIILNLTMVCFSLAEPALSQHNLCNSNLIRILCDSLLRPYSFCNLLHFKISCPLSDLLHMPLPPVSACSYCVCHTLVISPPFPSRIEMQTGKLSRVTS